MSILEKSAILIVLCIPLVLGWFAFKTSPHPIEDGKNVFESPIYTQYKRKIKNFVVNHPLYVTTKNANETNYDVKLNAILNEIEQPAVTPLAMRASHESLLKKIRELAQTPQSIDDKEQLSKKFFDEIVNWLFLDVDLKSEMQDFLYSYFSPPEEDLLDYLHNTQIKLHDLPQFNGVEHESPFEDQFILGNLPSSVALINNQTKLIRLGQPICQAARPFSWLITPQASPEFTLFLQSQQRHLYVNLMKSKGVENPLTKALEKIENKNDNFYVITLDKNSPFYWQKDKDYPDLLNSEKFKEIFLGELSSNKGNYFWSKHLDSLDWKLQLKALTDQVHDSIFNNQVILDRTERQDFIDITYLALLDHLVDKWKPTSMNITCRQGMDRGPSLMVLWLFQKGILDDKETTALLLAPPLVIHNRASHASKIERFISTARRLEKFRLQAISKSEEREEKLNAMSNKEGVI